MYLKAPVDWLPLLLWSCVLQWGPNATTWLLPSELFPTEVRAVAHGISAAAGKLGALAAGFAFAHMETDTTFIVSAVCAIVGAAVTFLFIPDVTSLDLSGDDGLNVMLTEFALVMVLVRSR